jgi:hypothetical protein
MNTKLALQGAFYATLTHKDGTATHYHNHNMILTSGFAFMAACMIASDDTRPPVLSKIAVGLDDAPTQASISGLGDELAAMPATATYSADSNTITIEASFGGDVVGAIKEAGVCNSDGAFLDRSTFDVINKTAEDELTVRFIISLTEIL